MLFNITNPSDPYTMEAPDLEIAAVAACLLGEGKYGLQELSGDKSGNVPLFMLGGVDEWFKRQFDRDFAASMEQIASTPPRRAQLVKALASVNIGTAATRREFDAKLAECTSPEECIALLHTMHDERRTSMNDIGRRAWSLGEAVMAGADGEGGDHG